MSSVALAMKQHIVTLAYIELLQSVVKGTDSMRWEIILESTSLIKPVLVKPGKA